MATNAPILPTSLRLDAAVPPELVDLHPARSPLLMRAATGQHALMHGWQGRPTYICGPIPATNSPGSVTQLPVWVPPQCEHAQLAILTTGLVQVDIESLTTTEAVTVMGNDLEGQDSNGPRIDAAVWVSFGEPLQLLSAPVWDWSVVTLEVTAAIHVGDTGAQDAGLYGLLIVPLLPVV